MNSAVAFLALGVASGILAGIFGVGGGIVIVPALVWIFGFSQHQAQGMSLVALLLPVGLLGALAYYRAHPFPLKPAFLIALGLFFGAYLGALLAQRYSERSLKIGFGCLLVAAGLKMIFGR